MATSTELSFFNTRDIPDDRIGFDYINEIVFDPTTTELTLKYRSGMTNNLGPVDPGLARKITNITLDPNNELVVDFDNGSQINVGTVMVEYVYGSDPIVGSGILSTEPNKFKPLTTTDVNITITNNGGLIDIAATLPDITDLSYLEGNQINSQYAWFVEEWNSTIATNAGLTTANVWYTRPLNSARFNNPGFTFNSGIGTVELPMGTYYITATGKTYRSGSVKLGLRDVVNNVTLLTGVSEVNIAGTASTQQNLAMRGYVRLSVPTTVALQQLSSTAGANSVLGVVTGANVDMGQTGTYAELSIWKVSDQYLEDIVFDTEIDALILALQEQYYHANNPVMTAVRDGFGLGLSVSADVPKWAGAVCATNNKIYGIPSDAGTILIIDAATNTATISNMGATLSGTAKWRGGVLGPDGKIYGIPSGSADILIIDPVLGTATRSNMGATFSGTNLWYGGCLGPDGKIYCVPAVSTDILIIDPIAGTATRSTMGATLTGSNKWFGGVLAPNGKIYCIPRDATDILIIDPLAGTATRSNMGATLSGTVKWYGGCLGSDGKIYGCPVNANTVLIIDPVTDTATTTNFGLTLTAAEKYHQGTLGPDGKIYFVPRASTNILIIDPITGTARTSNLGTAMSGNSVKYLGAVTGHNGKIYGIPAEDAEVLVISNASGISMSNTLTLSPHLNKF